MSFTLVPPQGSALVTLTANQKIAVKSQGEAQVIQQVGFLNYPPQNVPLKALNNETWVSSAFASGGVLLIQAQAFPVLFATGTAPVISDNGLWQPQAAPGTLNATGDLTAALMLGGIVTSSTAAAVTATPPTGALLDAATNIAIGESFDFSVINTGAANDFTISVGGGVAGHTLVGNMVVAKSTSGLFRTRKSAAATFITNRIAG